MNFNEAKTYILSYVKEDFNKRKFLELIKYLKENYFCIETNEDRKEKINNINELINLSIRFLKSTKNQGSEFNRQYFLPKLVEELTSKFINQNLSLFTILGFEKSSSKSPSFKDISTFLISINIYPKSLTQYSQNIQNEIFNYLINKKSGIHLSYYLIYSENKDEERILFQKFLLKNNLFPKYLDSIDNSFINKNTGIFTLLGFESPSSNKPTFLEISNFLIQIKMYSQDLSNYSISELEEAFKFILKKIKLGIKSYYLSSSNQKDKNLELFKEYLKIKLFPKSIEEITSKFISNENSIFTLFSEEKPKSKQYGLPKVYEILIENEFYKEDLSNYDDNELNYILKIILDNHTNTSHSFYLEYSNFKEKNKEIFKSSDLFLKFLKTKKNSIIKRFLNRFELSDKILISKPKSSILTAKWSDEELNHLMNLYNKDSESLISNIRNTNLASNDFGRSQNAVLSKLYYLTSSKKNSNIVLNAIPNEKIIKEFPKKVKSNFNELINYAYLHSKKTILNEFPITAYYYNYNGQLTDNHSFVFILPILYKSNNLEDYEDFEKIIISKLNGKLFDLNSQESLDDLKILKIRASHHLLGSDEFLVGISIVKKFSQNLKLKTCEIPEKIEFENGKSKEFKYWILFEE